MGNKRKMVGKILKPNKMIFLGALFLFIALLASSFFVVIKSKNVDKKANNIDLVNTVTSEEQQLKRTIYRSDMFNYIIEYPEELDVNQLGSGGGYIDFVRFEENANFKTKGFAIGVSEHNLPNEVKRIKNQFENENANLVEEKSVSFRGLAARQLHYKPMNPEDGEERLLIIFNRAPYTFSVSTVPSQIEEVLSKFEFIN